MLPPVMPKASITDAKNALVGDRAKSIQDVRAQMAGQPTAVQAAEAGTAVEPVAAYEVAMLAALQKAREHDRMGQGAACLARLAEAKRLRDAAS